MKLETLRKQDPLAEEMSRIKRKAQIAKQVEIVRKEFSKRLVELPKNKEREQKLKELLQWKKNLTDSFEKELEEISEKQKKFGSQH